MTHTFCSPAHIRTNMPANVLETIKDDADLHEVCDLALNLSCRPLHSLPHRCGSVVVISAAHAVGRGFAPWPGHT